MPASEIPRGPEGLNRVMQRAWDYCATMNMTTKQTGGQFDLGTGLDFIFSCMPQQPTVGRSAEMPASALLTQTAALGSIRVPRG